MHATLPAIDPDLANLRAEIDSCKRELEQEVIDLSDTITQWQAAKMKLAEQMRRRKDDP